MEGRFHRRRCQSIAMQRPIPRSRLRPSSRYCPDVRFTNCASDGAPSFAPNPRQLSVLIFSAAASRKNCRRTPTASCRQPCSGTLIVSSRRSIGTRKSDAQNNSQKRYDPNNGNCHDTLQLAKVALIFGPLQDFRLRIPGLICAPHVRAGGLSP